MNMRKLLLSVSAASLLFATATPMSAQANEQSLRDEIRSAVRSQLHLKADQFLAVQRDEKLEQLLAGVVARPSWSEFIYKVSEEGDEIREHTVVHHIVMDGDPTFTVAINPASGSLYRIQGFTDSLAEFNKLMTEANVKVLTPDQAEAVTSFYREVNPQRRSLVRLSSLLDLKQAGERQCQTSSFDTSEEAFNAWWKRTKPLYADVSFRETAASNNSGYLVEWIILSSPGSGGLCGGAPLRAQLEISANGHVGNLTFSPVQKPNG